MKAAIFGILCLFSISAFAGEFDSYNQGYQDGEAGIQRGYTPDDSTTYGIGYNDAVDDAWDDHRRAMREMFPDQDQPR